MPEGWQPLAGRVVPRPLYDVTPGALPGLMSRRRSARRVLRAAARELDWLYLRAPAWECSWALDAVLAERCRLIVELHGDWESAFRAEWAGHPLKRLLRHPVARWAHRRTGRMAAAADLLCCVGEALRDTYGPGRKAHVTTAHLVTEADFHRRADTCLGEPARVLFVGELVPRKGVAHLIDALRILRERGRAVALDIVGDGALRGELRARAARADLTPVVSFHGTVPHGSRLLEAFRRADVFALPSVAGEGVPRSIQEAMASSCPVVASDVGSVRYQLGRGRYGAVVPPGDANALAAAIEGILGDGDRRRATIAAAYDEALRHTVERESAAIRELLEANLPGELLSPGDQATLAT